MSIPCPHDGTEHPDGATYCMHCGRSLSTTVPPAGPPQLEWDVRDFSLAPDVAVQCRAMGFSAQSETAGADQQRLLTGTAQLAVSVRSGERENLERTPGHPLGPTVDLTRVDTLPETPLQLAGWLDARINQMMTDPSAWTVAVRWGLVGSVAFEAATVVDVVGTVIRRLLWAIGFVLACVVIFKTMGGADSLPWVAATCLVYLGATRVAGRLDQRYSQGPAGPPPPETYT